MSRQFEAYYSTHAIAAHFVTGMDAHVAERTIEREIERQPALKAVCVRKFGQVFVPRSALVAWLGISEPARHVPKAKGATAPVLLTPVFARSEGELHRKLAAVQTPGLTKEAHHG